MDLDDLVKGLLSEIGKVSKSDAVVGEVRDAGRAKMLPLSKISVAFGTGVVGFGGKNEKDGKQADAGIEGGGVGGAVVVEPKAFVVVGEDGVPHLLALKRGRQAVLRRGVELVPTEAPAALSPAPTPRKLPDGKK
ncbi:MAG: spore germination protein GerW family protein [Polyangiaceae bacterium]